MTIKGRGELIAKGWILDQGGYIAKISNKLGVAIQEGIQDPMTRGNEAISLVH